MLIGALRNPALQQHGPRCQALQILDENQLNLSETALGDYLDYLDLDYFKCNLIGQLRSNLAADSN